MNLRHSNDPLIYATSTLKRFMHLILFVFTSRVCQLEQNFLLWCNIMKKSLIMHRAPAWCMIRDFIILYIREFLVCLNYLYCQFLPLLPSYKFMINSRCFDSCVWMQNTHAHDTYNHSHYSIGVRFIGSV